MIEVAKLLEPPIDVLIRAQQPDPAEDERVIDADLHSGAHESVEHVARVGVHVAAETVDDHAHFDTLARTVRQCRDELIGDFARSESIFFEVH